MESESERSGRDPNVARRLIVISLGMVALSIAIVATLLVSDELVNYWYIFRLSSSNSEVQTSAVKVLSSRRSVRSIPYLLDLLKSSVHRDGLEETLVLSRSEHTDMILNTVKGMGKDAIGPMLRYLERSCEGEDGRGRLVALISIMEFCEDIPDGVPVKDLFFKLVQDSSTTGIVEDDLIRSITRCISSSQK